MKTIKQMLIVMVMAVTCNAQAACKDEGDTLRCNGGTVESIDYKGDVVLEGTTVQDKVKTIGDFTAKNATLNHLNIVGDVNIQNSTVNGSAMIVGDVEVRETKFDATTKIVGDTEFSKCEFQGDTVLVGDLNAKESLFRGDILLSAYNSQFTHTHLNNLTVKKQSRDIDQTIYLKEGSVANNINFQSNKGIVALSEGSSVKGKVTGGKIETE